MKLLIDIPEHIYEHAKETTEDSRDEFDAMRAIANGTQQESRSEIPNTCGDAISRDELLKAMDTWDKFGYTETGCFVREPKNDCVKYIHYDDVIKCIKGMPPVTPQTNNGMPIDVVNCWIGKEVLFKIRDRVELEKLGYPPSAGYYRAIMKVLQIIDKYKAESEDKE